MSDTSRGFIDPLFPILIEAELSASTIAGLVEHTAEEGRRDMVDLCTVENRVARDEYSFDEINHKLNQINRLQYKWVSADIGAQSEIHRERNPSNSLILSWSGWRDCLRPSGMRCAIRRMGFSQKPMRSNLGLTAGFSSRRPSLPR
jgi:hypothetical protein